MGGFAQRCDHLFQMPALVQTLLARAATAVPTPERVIPETSEVQA